MDTPPRPTPRRDAEAHGELAEWEKGILSDDPAIRNRRLAVLRDLADGFPLKEIAADLETSEQTLKNLLRTIRANLECSTTIQVVALALRRGWIE
jgi:DNA-binding NarL/FixJ family response regulator